MRILFVCTGNMCRSPLAERLARAWATDRLGKAASLLDISSAGTDAPEGREMDSRSARALAELGGSSDGCRSRALALGEADGMDIVLTMARRHRHSLLKRAPRAMRRTFTLAEASALLSIADTAGIAGLPLQQRARELALRLNLGRARRPNVAEDDIPDPIGQSLDVHRQVAAQIAGSLEPLMDVLLAPVRQAVQYRPSHLPPVPPSARARPGAADAAGAIGLRRALASYG